MELGSPSCHSQSRLTGRYRQIMQAQGGLHRTLSLIRETRTPIVMRPGQTARHDYEYERNGTANIFMLLAPLEGWRRVEVSDRRAQAAAWNATRNARHAKVN